MTRTFYALEIRHSPHTGQSIYRVYAFTSAARRDLWVQAIYPPGTARTPYDRYLGRTRQPARATDPDVRRILRGAPESLVLDEAPDST